MRKGKIKWYNTGLKYGFITPEDGGRDVFFVSTHAAAAGLIRVETGVRVDFESVIRDQGEIATTIYASSPASNEIYRQLVDRAQQLIDHNDPDARLDGVLMSQAAAALVARGTSP